ncbi:MAG: hypothetical protein AB7Q97_25225 [Gammaproteobacteria bacterium]
MHGEPESAVAAGPVARARQSPFWRHLARIGTGHALYATFNWFFDNVLYVYVVYQWGMLRGGAVMTALSFLQCAATLIVYQRMGIDWVGAGLLAQMKRKPEPTRVERLLVWAADRNRVLIFVLLCVFQDPFITTAWFKEGRFDALTRRDWHIFVAAVLVSNLYWIFVASLIGQAVVAAWRFLQGLF